MFRTTFPYSRPRSLCALLLAGPLFRTASLARPPWYHRPATCLLLPCSCSVLLLCCTYCPAHPSFNQFFPCKPPLRRPPSVMAAAKQLGRSTCWSRGIALPMRNANLAWPPRDSRQRAFGGTPQRLVPKTGAHVASKARLGVTSVMESSSRCSCTTQARIQAAQRQDTRPFERAAHDDMQHHGDTSVELPSGSMAVLAGAALGRNGGARGNPRGL